MNQNEKILTIVVPTYNHYSYIDYILNKYIDLLHDNKIIVEIHDSSDNSETMDLVNSYKFDNLKYIHYDSKINVDIKTYLALSNVRTKYTYLCGDGYILNYSKINEIYSLIEKDYDVIQFFSTNYKKYFETISKNKYKIYKNITEHFVDNYWYMGLYGGSIIKSKIFQELSFNIVFGQNDISDVVYNGFIYPYTIYSYFSNKDFSAYVCCDNYFLPNPLKKTPTWMHKGIVFEILIDNYDITLKRLPDVFNPYKQYALSNMVDNVGFLKIKSLCNYRISNDFNYNLYKKYRKKIFNRTNTNHLLIFLISITPVFFIKIAKRLYKGGK